MKVQASPPAAKRWGVRDLVYVAIFGALWGGLELSLGSYLHVLKVPFVGVVMASLGLLLALVGRLFVPRRGAVWMMGVVTALLKMLSLGGVVLNPMLGILAEATLAELALDALGRPSRLAFAVAGGAGVLWVFFHPFVTQGLLAGRGLLTVYGWAIASGARLLGFPPEAVGAIVAALLGLHLGAGAAAGLLAWQVGQAVQRRLGATAEDPAP
ncbi:MAG: hypothetical protein H5T59_08920 [Anaerolineae bacterium]|nr:hypothetical protein [Anaerolineae bacterium]